MRSLFFSAQGRLGRAGFWKGVLVIIGAEMLMAILLFGLSRILPGEPTDDGSFKVQGLAALPYIGISLAFVVATAWAGLCIAIKRFHDRDKSGAWVLIQLVPFIGPVWFFIEAGCFAGTPGPNRFGPDPRQLSAPLSGFVPT